MPEMRDEFLFPRRPTAERPLLGQTVLVVEDSRFAGEALRLMCLKGGARIRRADCLHAAARHLQTYRPSVVIADFGLPDGSGTGLIAQLSATRPRVPVLLALSGDPEAEEAALAAGADGFLAKPLGSVAAVHAQILSHLPAEQRPMGLRTVRDQPILPGAEALQDDLCHVADLLDGPDDADTRAYAAAFAFGLGRSIGDGPLIQSARSARDALRGGTPCGPAFAELAALVRTRLHNRAVAV